MLTELNILGQSLAQTWLTFSVVLAVQIGLVLLMRKPVRTCLGAAACYRLWLLPLVCLPFYLSGPALIEKLASLENTVPHVESQSVAALQQFIEFELLPFNPDSSTWALSTGDDPIANGWLVFALAWVAGTLALLAWQGRRWLDFSRRVRVLALPLSDPERTHCGAAAHFGSGVPVLSFEGMSSAALFGIIRPTLLLPASFCHRYDSNQRHIILAHEAVHLQRRDNGWNLCALLVTALFWTNPLVLLAWRYYRLDQELSCDALALTRCTKEQQKCYARTLLASLDSLSPHINRPALSAWDDLRDIKQRSRMIKQHLHTATRPIAALFSLLTLAVLGASLTVAFAELVTPVAQAAEPVQRTQVAQSVTQEVPQIAQIPQQTQEAPQGLQAPQQITQEAQQVAQVPQQIAQGAPQLSQTPRQVAREAQQVAQVPKQATHEAQQVAQAPQRISQEAQQVTQAPQRVSQEGRQVTQATQQQQQEVPKVFQASQQVTQKPREVTREAQQPSQVRRQIYSGGRSSRAESPTGMTPNVIDELTGRVMMEVVALMNKSQFAEARERLAGLSVDRLSPFEKSRVHQMLFTLEMNEENRPAAREQLRLAIDSRGLNTQETLALRYQLAQLYLQEEKYAEAAAELEGLIASEPTPTSAVYYLLAVSHYHLNQFDEGLGYAKQAVELARRDGDIPPEGHLNMLASLYIELKQFDAAEGVVAELVELFPDHDMYRKQLEDLKARNSQQ